MRKILLLAASVLVLLSMSVSAPADDNPCCSSAAILCADVLCAPCGVQIFNCTSVPPNACAPVCVCKPCR